MQGDDGFKGESSVVHLLPITFIGHLVSDVDGHCMKPNSRYAVGYVAGAGATHQLYQSDRQPAAKVLFIMPISSL